MTNPFFVDPTYGADPNALSGLGNTLAMIGEQRRKQEAEQAAIESQQAMQADIMSAIQSGNPEQMTVAAVKYPQMSDMIYKQLGVQSDKQKTEMAGFTRDILTSSPDQIEFKFQERVTQLQNQGRDATDTIKQYQDWLDNPEGEIKDLEAFYAGVDPKGYESLKREASEARKVDELDLKRETLDLRKRESKLREQELKASRETNQLKREKLEADIEAKRRKIEADKKAVTDAQQSAVSSLDSSVATVDRLLSHPGLEDAVGFSTTPGFTVPGTDKADFLAELDAFDAQNFLTSIKQMTGMGSLSDAEGRKISAAVGAINPNMSEEAFKKSLLTIKEGFETAKRNLGAVDQSPELSVDDQALKWARENPNDPRSARILAIQG